jgi:predicted dehydrogenase
MHDPAAFFRSTPKPAGITELGYQIQRFHSFLWASGGCFSDYYIHIIDNCCWMKNAWPVSAQALGARHFRETPEGVPYIDQNFDVYSVEYTFADGAKFFFDGRCMTDCANIYCNFVHGSKGMGIISRQSDFGPPSTIYKGQLPKKSNMLWQSKASPDDDGPYQNEWNALLAAIRGNKPYNEVKRGVEASLVTAMGRMAAHTGQEITFDAMLNCAHEFAPNVDKLTSLDSPAPLLPGPNGKYPVPLPGVNKTKEY